MGTRNLTCVFVDGEYKVAKYGQWDGYPRVGGINVLEGAREYCNTLAKRKVFADKVRRVTPLTEERIKQLWRKCGCRNGAPTKKQLERIKTEYPQTLRDTGHGIIKWIGSLPAGAPLELMNSLDFAADSLFCEWAWVIDLDLGVFQGFKGCNKKKPVKTERFAFLNKVAAADYKRRLEEYKAARLKHPSIKFRRPSRFWPVTLCGEWSLSKLPTNRQFLAYFEG